MGHTSKSIKGIFVANLVAPHNAFAGVKVFTEAGEAVDGVLAFAVQDGLQSVTPSSSPARDQILLELAGCGPTP